MPSFIELIIYYTVKAVAFMVQRLPVTAALSFGRALGRMAYYCDLKHKRLVYNNIKIAFSGKKKPRDIRRIVKTCFQNYGQNFIELLRLPLMNPGLFKKYIQIEGEEHITKALEQGRGVILLAMHFGSWELASLACTMMGRPYKVVVKPQSLSRLDDLLNSYRECGGSVIIERGTGTREFVKSLMENKIVGMVVDQGGKEGLRVPFFNRRASMSVGAIRIGMKFQTSLCFAVINRIKGPYHRLTIHPPLELERTPDQEKDIETNLIKVTSLMEQYIREFPSEYMWFYKIWKYSNDVLTVILDDGRVGHLRQSQAVARQLEQVLGKRGIRAATLVVQVTFKSRMARRLLGWLSLFANVWPYQWGPGILRWFLTPESFARLLTVKADTIISCGSSTAAVNDLLADDQQAKAIAILRPGLMNANRFDLVVVPQHDVKGRPFGSPLVRGLWPMATARTSTASSHGMKPVASDAVADSKKVKKNVIVTKGAPNLINSAYIEEQTQALLRRFSHLQIRDKFMLGLLIGGSTRWGGLNEKSMKMIIHQIKEVLNELDADILISTSRRTPEKIESLVQREFKRLTACKLLILANANNVPEAVGGILGLSDLLVVSGDSISMVSEAASSGKKTLVFPVKGSFDDQDNKQLRFIQKLHEQGYILCSDPLNIKQGVYALAKNKIQTRVLDDNAVLKEGLGQIF